MTDQNTQFNRPSGGSALWTVVAVVIAAIVLAPVVSVVWIAFHPTENIWPHLISTVLPRYLGNTFLLGAGVAVITCVVGTVTAWLVTMYRFPGAGWLGHALLFPLAIPAYVSAYALVDFLDYSGLLQVSMRAAFGWANARDYWFPEVRSIWAAMLVLSFTLYPYVYLLARAAFREQSAGVYEVARALGAGQLSLFWRVGVPLARPAIMAGAALVLMETVADFGTVQHFGVQTLTTGIFSTWLNGNNAGGAAQIAGVVLMVVFLLLSLETISRRRARFHQSSRSSRPVVPMRLTGGRGAAAFAACFVPFLLGFVLPVLVMGQLALSKPEVWLADGLGTALFNTLTVAGGAALATVMAAILLVYAVRLGRSRVARAVLPITAVGYAAPGAVLAVGLLLPLASFDNWLADRILGLTGVDPGLMITGTAMALGLAYLVRFFGIAQGAVDSAFGRVSPSLSMAARSLGQGAGGTLAHVYLPLMRGSVATALLVVFVDCVKELPATLLLRPFNYNTLATRVYELASLERLNEAAPAALIVMAVGLVAVALLARANKA